MIPLLPGYSFNAHLVAGLTPIEANGYLDFFYRPTTGNEGLYSQSHHTRPGGGEKIRDENLSADRVIFCCSRQGEIHHYGRHPEAREWYHQWVYFRPRAYWHEWLN